MTNTPKNFRQKKTPSLTKGGKLPNSSFYHTLSQTIDLLGWKDTGNAYLDEFKSDSLEFFQCPTIGKISILDSKKTNYTLAGTELVIPTGFLLDLTSHLYDMIEKEGNTAQPSRHCEYRKVIYKLLDIIYFVKESAYDVVSTKEHKKLTHRYSYRRNRNVDLGASTFPMLSRRYENTSFYNTAQELYSEVMDFSDWNLDLSFPLRGLPLNVLKSEILQYRMSQ